MFSSRLAPLRSGPAPLRLKTASGFTLLRFLCLFAARDFPVPSAKLAVKKYKL
jgi:hypothetical protein